MEPFIIKLDDRSDQYKSPIVQARIQQELLEQALILEVAAKSSSFLKYRFEQDDGKIIKRKPESDGERKQVIDNFIALWRKNLCQGDDSVAGQLSQTTPISRSKEEHLGPKTSYQASKYFQDTIPSAKNNLTTWVEQGLRSHYQSFLAVESLGKPP